MSTARLATAILAAASLATAPTPAAADPTPVPVPVPVDDDAPRPWLKVGGDGRFLVRADGQPFFYLADTAWELLHRLDRDEAERYLRDRAQKGFTVVQTVALAELDGLRVPNPYGHTPLIENDPARPDTRYFEHVDWIVDRAAALGLAVGLLPTWGDKWNADQGGAGPVVFDPDNAETFGEWLGNRYRDRRNIVWILGGDRSIGNDRHREIIRAMARGLRRGDRGAHLITFHPRGGEGSSQWFRGEDWIDFHMRQNGHAPEFTGRYDKTRADYDLQPVRPVLDGEPVYEDHPVAFNAPALGYTVAADVRRPMYWNLFQGAFGHAYGHHSVWQMRKSGEKGVNNPLMTWEEALDQPGARQMIHGRRLLESRPFLSRIPDDSLVVPDDVPAAVPGAGVRRFVATRDQSRSYAMIYAPVGRPFRVRLDALSGPELKAWWFNPRDGKAAPAGEFPNAGIRTFVPPDPGEFLDWILVLDDASRNYPPPGSPR